LDVKLLVHHVTTAARFVFEMSGTYTQNQAMPNIVICLAAVWHKANKHTGFRGICNPIFRLVLTKFLQGLTDVVVVVVAAAAVNTHLQFSRISKHNYYLVQCCYTHNTTI
jgi:hypothetical protein